MMFKLTLEQEILLHHRPKTQWTEEAMQDQNKAIKLLNVLHIYKTDPQPYLFYDATIKKRLPEALLSPIAWIRERASQLSKES